MIDFADIEARLRKHAKDLRAFYGSSRDARDAADLEDIAADALRDLRTIAAENHVNAMACLVAKDAVILERDAIKRESARLRALGDRIKFEANSDGGLCARLDEEISRWPTS